MSDKINWWMIIGIVIVVAVLASLITVKLSGNVIKVPTSVATTQTDVYTKAEIDAKLIKPTTTGTYYNCYKKGGSTIGWGNSVYQNNLTILTNSLTVECGINEDIILSDFTCNPRFWEQRVPVYVSGVAIGSRIQNNATINGRTLTCTGGESQGIMNINCCKKS